MKLESLLTRIKESIEIEDDKSYKRVTIKTKNQGVHLRDILKGSDIGTKKQFVVHEGQFLLSKIDAMNGAFGIVPKILDGAIITGNFWTFDVNKDLMDIEWFNLLTSSSKFIEICRELSSGTTNRRYLDEKKFSEYVFKLPNLEEQKTVVKRVNLFNKKNDMIKSEILNQKNIISALRQSILNEAIQGKLLPQDPNDEPANELLEQIKEEKQKLIQEGKLKKQPELKPIKEDEIPFKAPKGWDLARIGDVFSVSTGSTPLRSRTDFFEGGNIPWVTSSATDKLFIEKADEYITENALKESNLKLFPKGSLIVALYGQGKTRGQVSELLIDATTNQACAVLTSIISQDIFRKYVKIFFRNQYVDLRKLAAGGAQPNLNLLKIKETIIPVPPIKEQKRINEKVNLLMNFCDQLENRIAQLIFDNAKLLGSILQEAFTENTYDEKLEDLNLSLGEFIKQSREGKGITVTNMIKMIGNMKLSEYSGIEAGMIQPDYSTKYKIASVLNLDEPEVNIMLKLPLSTNTKNSEVFASDNLLSIAARISR
jgi:type I restriction enzyme S subunit